MNDVTLEAMRKDDDWFYVWKNSKIELCLGADCSTASIDVESVARVLQAVEGDGNGMPWLAVVELRDGRFAFVQAGDNMTCGHCGIEGTVWVSDTLENLMRFGVTDNAREAFGGT